MFFSSVALIALTLAIAARRPVARLMERRFRRLELLWLAIGLRLLFVPAALYPFLSTIPYPGLPRVGGLLYILSLLLVVAFTWLNRRVPGVPLIGLGLLMNALVITANGGQMPVDPGQLAAIGQLEEMQETERIGEWSTFAVMKEGTRLSFLGDRIPIPMPFKEPTILSLGDLAIAAGILLFFFVIPEARRSSGSSSSLRAGTTSIGNG